MKIEQFTKVLEFPLKLLQKKEVKNKEYPSFMLRMLTGLIDMTVAALLITPICAVVLGIAYNNMPPSKKMATILNKVYSEQKHDAKAPVSRLEAVDADVLSKNQEYQEFMRTQGYWAIFQEKLIELTFLASSIFVCWLFFASTPAKLLFGMKILNSKTLTKPTTYQYIVRILAYAVSVLPLGLGFVTMLFNKQKRSLHDIISGTVVVTTKHLKI